MVQSVGIILTKQFGSNKFEFNVTSISNRYNGIMYKVNVKQTTFFTEEESKELGFDINVINWTFSPDFQTTEFGAINYAGKKLIEKWINI
jgi:hypothetical protein